MATPDWVLGPRIRRDGRAWSLTSSSATGSRRLPDVSSVEGIDPSVPPSGPGCVDCDASGGWWFHLRRCAQCGRIGCCDSSPAQHASAHAAATGHPLIQSYEPGEAWFWDYRTNDFY